MSQDNPVPGTRSFTNRYEDSLSHVEQGLARFEAGDVQGAIAELQLALRYDRENTLAHGNLGLIYYRTGRLDEAQREYQTALRLEPSDHWLHRGLAAVYEAKGQLEKAQLEYRRAVDLDATDAVGRFGLGNALLAQGKLEEAVDAFCDALEIDPRYDAARSRLAGIYRGRGMNEAALEQYGIVARRNKDNELGSVALQRTALIGRPQWPMAGRDPAHTAHEPALLNPPLGIRWQFDTPGDVVAPLIAFHGAIYVACKVSHAAESRLYALDAVTGEELWHFSVPGGASISTTPAAGDGLVLVGTGAGTLYALDGAVGRIAWQWDTQGPIRSAPVVADSTVYIGSEDHRLYALDLLTGQQRWSLQTGGVVSIPPAVDKGRVFVGAADRRFRAVNARTGEEQWSVNIGEALCTPLVLDLTVFVATTDYELHALVAASGKHRWTAKFKRMSNGFPDMAAWESRLYLSYGNVLAAIDIISGQIEWEVPLTDVDTLSAPALAGQMLYVAARHPGRLYAFDTARGQKRWEYNLSHPLTTPPTAIYRTVLVGSEAAQRETPSGQRTWAGAVFALGPPG